MCYWGIGLLYFTSMHTPLLTIWEINHGKFQQGDGGLEPGKFQGRRHFRLNSRIILTGNSKEGGGHFILIVLDNCKFAQHDLLLCLTSPLAIAIHRETVMLHQYIPYITVVTNPLLKWGLELLYGIDLWHRTELKKS